MKLNLAVGKQEFNSLFKLIKLVTSLIETERLMEQSLLELFDDIKLPKSTLSA